MAFTKLCVEMRDGADGEEPIWFEVRLYLSPDDIKPAIMVGGQVAAIAGEAAAATRSRIEDSCRRTVGVLLEQFSNPNRPSGESAAGIQFHSYQAGNAAASNGAIRSSIAIGADRTSSVS